MFHSNPNESVGNRAGAGFPEFDIELQPIVDVEQESVFAYEALCRGRNGDHYPKLVAEMTPQELRRFDKVAMVKALRLAADLGLEGTGAKISLNVAPVAGADARFVHRVAKHYGIRSSSIVLEMTEGIRMDCSGLARIMRNHRAAGVVVAIDDFGAGYAGLNRLATCTPSVLKVDRELIHGIESNRVKKMIVEGVAEVCRKLTIQIIAEGVETVAECRTLQEVGISLMQGYLFASPMACAMPLVYFPERWRRRLPRVSQKDRLWLRRTLRQ